MVIGYAEYGLLISCVIDVVIDNEIRDRFLPCIGSNQVQHASEGIRIQAVIGIHCFEVQAKGIGNAGIQTGPVSAVFLMNDTHTVRIVTDEGVRDGTGSVMGTVIDNENIQLITAGEQGLYAFLHIILRIITGNQKGEKLHAERSPIK